MLLRAIDLHKSYLSYGREYHVLQGVNLEIAAGSVVGLVGESGCGKSTLARIITGQLAPERGQVCWSGSPLPELRRRSFAEAKAIQYIFQDPYAALETERTVEQILLEPIRICARHRQPPRLSAAEAVRLVGLGAWEQWAKHMVGQLSGGQRQRLALARALIPGPRLIIADESTSMLDDETAASLLVILRELVAGGDLSVLLISHQLRLVRQSCDYIYIMQSGRIVEHGRKESLLTHPASEYGRALADSLRYFEEE